MTTPLVEMTAPIVEMTAPLAEMTAPLVEMTTPIVEMTAPLVEMTTPIVELSYDIVQLLYYMDRVELPSSQESGRGFTLRVGSRSASSGGDVVILHTRVHHQSENRKWPKATSDFCSDLHEWCVKLLHHDCIIEVQITSGRRL